MHEADWRHAVVAAVGAAEKASWRRAGGSSLNATWELRCAEARYFVKTNDASRLAMMEAEGEGLSEIAATRSVRVPLPVATGSAAGTSYLVLEWLDFGGRYCGAALGAALARMHRVVAEAFGWHRDNTIGTTPQRNPHTADWIEFYRDHRLRYQLALAAANGHRGHLQESGARLDERLAVFFDGYSPQPSLLHGDLWGGNWACLASDEPAIFDPAVYYGDREADVAMTELFGGFPPEFYDAYREAWPLDAGYAVRKTLYNLYHVLNHLNLFGSGYLHQAESMIVRLLAEAL